MKQYKYVALNNNKEKKKGYFLAKDEEDLAVQLSRQGLYLVSAKLYTGKTPSAFFTLGTGKVNISELTLFCRQYSIMLNSGISLLDAIEILKEQNFSNYFKSLLNVVYDDVKGGQMLSDALAKHKNVFPNFFHSMIKIGENSGRLNEVMSSLADYYEKDRALKRKVKTAFAYPIFLFCMMIGIVILMLTYVIPTFRKTLNDLGIPEKGFSKVIFTMSDFLLNYWLYLLAGIVVLAVLLFLFGKTEKGRYIYDWIKVNFPIFKKINVNLITARFARGFGLLLSSGMDVNDALDAVTIVFENKDVEKRFKMAAEDIRMGLPLSIAFENYNLFPPIMLQMISVGERTASLDDVLKRSCSFYDDLVESALTSAAAKIQPVMLLILGVVVGVMFIAVYSPILDMMTL